MDNQRSDHPSGVSLLLHEFQTELSTMDIESVMILDCLKDPTRKNLKEAEQSAHAIRSKIREISTNIRIHLYDSGSKSESAARQTPFVPDDFFQGLVQRWNRDPKVVITLVVQDRIEERVDEEGTRAEEPEVFSDEVSEDTPDIIPKGAPGRERDAGSDGEQDKEREGAPGKGQDKGQKLGPEGEQDTNPLEVPEGTQTTVHEHVPDGLTDAVQEPGLEWRSGEDRSIRNTLTLPFSFQAFRLIMDVLLSNAVRFRKGDRANITLEVKTGPDLLKICCRDEGIGIPNEEIHHIGKFFFRAGNTTGTDGNGVALHFVISLIRDFGGDVKIHSQEGIYTVIELLIPAKPA